MSAFDITPLRIFSTSLRLFLARLSPQNGVPRKEKKRVFLIKKQQLVSIDYGDKLFAILFFLSFHSTKQALVDALIGEGSSMKITGDIHMGQVRTQFGK